MGQRAVPERCINTLAPDRDLQAVGRFEPPERRHDGTRVGHLVEHRVRRRRSFVFEVPAQCERGVDNQGHRRPSLIRSVILSPPSVTPLLISLIPWAAARASSCRSRFWSSSMAVPLTPWAFRNPSISAGVPRLRRPHKSAAVRWPSLYSSSASASSARRERSPPAALSRWASSSGICRVTSMVVVLFSARGAHREFVYHGQSPASISRMIKDVIMREIEPGREKLLTANQFGTPIRFR